MGRESEMARRFARQGSVQFEDLDRCKSWGHLVDQHAIAISKRLAPIDYLPISRENRERQPDPLQKQLGRLPILTQQRAPRAFARRSGLIWKCSTSTREYSWRLCAGSIGLPLGKLAARNNNRFLTGRGSVRGLILSPDRQSGLRLARRYRPDSTYSSELWNISKPIPNTRFSSNRL